MPKKFYFATLTTSAIPLRVSNVFTLNSLIQDLVLSEILVLAKEPPKLFQSCSSAYFMYVPLWKCSLKKFKQFLSIKRVSLSKRCEDWTKNWDWAKNRNNKIETRTFLSGRYHQQIRFCTFKNRKLLFTASKVLSWTCCQKPVLIVLSPYVSFLPSQVHMFHRDT